MARLNEKPPPGEEYSSLAVIGRYVFTPAIFDAIRHTRPGRGGEIQLTDAIDHLARADARTEGAFWVSCFVDAGTTRATRWST